jgi:hypothetical protein
MTPEQAAAFVNAQTACMLAELAAMQSRDALSVRTGTTPHHPQEYRDLPARFGLGSNDVHALFIDVNR